jgi:D-arabinose 1-dehydrogenase-like Zn-dependent alcohol dehydrogenase
MIMQIRAHAIREKGGKAEPFLYERALGSHDVLVRITHCSIARGDIQYMDNDWGDTRFPLVAGHEIATAAWPNTSSWMIGSPSGSRQSSIQPSRPLCSRPASPYRRGFFRPDCPTALEWRCWASEGWVTWQLIERLGGAFADSSDTARHQGAFDFILSTLNVAFDLDSYVRMLNPQGQLCLVAAPLKALSLSGGLLNNSRRSIYGNYIGSRRDTTQMLEFAAEHGIEAIVDVMPIARVNEAIERVRTRAVRMGLVLETPGLDA